MQARASGSSRGMSFLPDSKNLPRPSDLETHQFTKRLIYDAIRQVRFGDAEATQLVLRDVHAVAFGVLLDVSEDVGQLHRKAQVDGVGLDILGCSSWPKILMLTSPDHRGDLVAILPETVERLIAREVEVHLHAGYDLVEVLPGDSEAVGSIAQAPQRQARRTGP